MATPMKPLVQGGSYYPSRVWTPFVKGNGFTTQDGGEERGVPKTVSGALIHVLDALAAPVRALSVAINPVQSGSGDPAPDNVRPISGWTQAKVTRTGKNLLEKPFSFRPVPVKFSDCFFIKAGTYRFSFSSIGTATKWRLCVAEFDISGNALSDNAHKPNPGLGWAASVQAWYGGNDTTSKATTLTFVEDCYIRIQFGSGNTSSSMTSVDAQLEVGTTETEYEPYSGMTLTIDLDGTVYGGTLDVLTGVLTVDRVLVTNNGSSSGTYGYGSFPYISLPGGAIYKGGAPTEAITNLAVPTGITNGYILRFANGISGVTDKASFGALLAQTPMQIVAPLAAPQTVQLDPAQLTLLAGENYVWCDTGDISLTYKAAEPNKVGIAKVGTAKAG